MNKSGFIWVLLTLAFAALSAILGVQVYNLSQNDMAKAAVATVNGKVISKQALYDKLVAQNGREALDRMIEDKLVRQEAKKAGVTVTAADVQAEMDKIRQQFSSEAQFLSALSQYGMDVAELERRVEFNLFIQRILEPQIRQELTEEKLRSIFEERKAEYEFRARHILVETEDEAKAILEQLKGGADFAQLAKEKSIDTGSGARGGDLGFFGKGRMVPEFEQAVATGPVGGDPQIVQSQFGFHVVQVLMREPTFEQVQKELTDSLVDEELGNRSGPWLQELKAKAAITNTLEKAQ